MKSRFLVVLALLAAALYFAFNWWKGQSKKHIDEFKKDYNGLWMWAEGLDSDFVITKKQNNKWVITFDYLSPAEKSEAEKHSKIYSNVQIKVA